MKKEYIAPESKIMEVRAEGMLCASGTFEAKPQGTQSTNSIQIWDNQDVAW